jgi:hypothetical protein
MVLCCCDVTWRRIFDEESIQASEIFRGLSLRTPMLMIVVEEVDLTELTMTIRGT